jgi:hypothetical protein
MRGRSTGATRLVGLIVAGGIAFGAAGAHAGTNDDEAERLITAGVALRQQAKDEEALTQFARAYELAHDPRARAQMGLAEEALGRWERAEAHLTEALSATTPWITKRQGDLSAALEDIRGHLGDLEVLGGVAGAEVQLNGETVARLPLAKALRVAAGTVALEMRAPGYLPVIRNVNVPARGLARESVLMTRDATATPADAGQPVPPVVIAEVRAQPPAGPPAWRKPAAWTTAAAAAVALGVGVGFTIRVYSNADKFNQSCGAADPGMGGGLCPTYWNRSHDSETPAVVGYALAAALGGASAYLFWSGREAATPRLATWRCAPQLLEPGLSCGATF